MSPPLRRSITVGVAGHVDHGKTALVLALTGIDCDRLPEEKRRGMTLDLGFAHFRTDEARIGFVDVPGHQNFLPNALAGLAGLDALLLVVAANEGVRPQTKEHLAIAAWLQVPRLWVILSKIDLVEPEIAALASMEVEELLANSPFRGAPIYPTSARTGAGVPELKLALIDLARRASDPPVDRPVRLPIDRMFTLTGRGRIVTGTLLSGLVEPGVELEVLPGNERVRVRAVQVHGVAVTAAMAGERTALQLGGGSDFELRRGHELVTPGAVRLSRRFLVALEWNPEVPFPIQPMPVEVYLATSWSPGRLLPIEPFSEGRGLAELRLALPLLAVRGNCFVVRRPSPPLTLGGGQVLDPRFRRPIRNQRSWSFGPLAGSVEDALCVWLARAGPRGLLLSELDQRLLLGVRELSALLKPLQRTGKVVFQTPADAIRENPRVFLADSLRQLHEWVRARLPQIFGHASDGVPKAEFAQRALPRAALVETDFHLKWMDSLRLIRLEADRVYPATFSPRTELSPLGKRIVDQAAQKGLEGTTIAELARDLQAPRELVVGVVEKLVRHGTLVRHPEGILAPRSTLDRLAEEIRRTGWTEFSVTQFKERFGLSRRLAIPWLELLDNAEVTLRHGDRRTVRPTPGRQIQDSAGRDPKS